MTGSGERGVIVRAPPPPILKMMRSRPTVALALSMACRNEPAPESATLVTVKVAAEAPVAASHSHTTARNECVFIVSQRRSDDGSHPRYCSSEMTESYASLSKSPAIHNCKKHGQRQIRRGA